MSAHRTNNFPDPAPKPLEQLTRAQVAARVAIVRECVDMMVTQAQMDGGPAFECLGACKAVLFNQGQRLRAMANTELGQLLEASQPIQPCTEQAAEPQRSAPFAPTERQVAFYTRLAESPVFSEEERRRALDWLAAKATRQTIKDQIDWLKRQVETRQPAGAK